MIGLGVAGDHAAELRDDIEGIEIVEGIETGDVDGREFEAEETSADGEHAMCFRERDGNARHIADAERDGDRIERAICKRQRLRVGLEERRGLIEALLGKRAARPTASMSGLMSTMVARVAGPDAASTRSATSPVPPARSRSE